MRIVRKPADLRLLIRRAKGRGKRVGFVPTMGALHEGHYSLIRRARRESDCVVVSIFVNPIQFNRKKDLRSYPRMLRHDAQGASEAGADILFVPSADAMYPPDFQTSIEVKRLTQLWEGKFRPAHFQGVATVVTKLFHLVQPDLAYFGEKDAQQARIIKQLIQDLNFDLTLRICPTVREKDGLALSSRNRLLSSSARRSSSVLFQALQEARRLIKCGERRGFIVVRRMKGLIREKVPGARIDYAAVVDRKTFESVRTIQGPMYLLLAVWIGSVRLIDCCPVNPS